MTFVPNGMETTKEIANKISESLAFMKACGITSENTPQLNQTTLFTSHEALLLNYYKYLLEFLRP